MGNGKPRRFSAEFKAEVASAVLRGEASLAGLATRFEVAPNLIAQWKRRASQGLVAAFSGKASRGEVVGEAQGKQPQAMIGRLRIARGFLAMAAGRCAAIGAKARLNRIELMA